MAQVALIRAALLVALFALAAPAVAAPPVEARCVRVHDGDTLTVRLADGDHPVRLLGVDAAELAQPGPWGARARDALRGLVLGRTVRLVFDVAPRDRYGRLLAWVWVGDTFVNLALVRGGLAVVYTVPPNVLHAETLVAAQREARAAGRGLWGPEAPLAQEPRDFRRAHRPDSR